MDLGHVTDYMRLFEPCQSMNCRPYSRRGGDGKEDSMEIMLFAQIAKHGGFHLAKVIRLIIIFARTAERI